MVKLNDGYSYSYDDLHNILANNLAKYKIPVEIEFVNDLPKTINGKIDKNAIKNFFNNKKTE